jgi:hypothetical protein
MLSPLSLFAAQLKGIFTAIAAMLHETAPALGLCREKSLAIQIQTHVLTNQPKDCLYYWGLAL